MHFFYPVHIDITVITMHIVRTSQFASAMKCQKGEVSLDTKVCDADAHITEGNKQNLDEDGCRSACLATQECKFYLHTAQLKQCELLKKCDRIGATGEKLVELDAFVAHCGV